MGINYGQFRNRSEDLRDLPGTVLESIGDTNINYSKYDYTETAVLVNENLDKVQARLVFTDDVLLNPSSGVRFFEYSFIPKSQRAAYNKELKQIANDISKKILRLNILQEQDEELQGPCDQIPVEHIQIEERDEPAIDDSAISTGQSNIMQENQINQKRVLVQKIFQDILSFAQRFPTQARRIEVTIRKFKDKYAPQMQELKDLKAQYDGLLQQNTVTSDFVNLYTDRLDKFLEILDTFKKKLYLAIEQAIEQQHQNQQPREPSLAQRLAKAMKGLGA